MANITGKKRDIEDVIKSKLLSTKEWKIKTGILKRLDYENQRKDQFTKIKSHHATVHILPFGTNEDLDRISKNKYVGSKSSPKQPMTRFSRVFNKSMITPKNKISDIAKKHSSRKEEILQLQELSFDKTYFNRVLWDEHVRMLYLRNCRVSQTVLRSKPYLRLWMEALMTNVAEKSRHLRNVLRNEIVFLSNRYQVQRQLHFWQTLHSLTLDELYHKKCQIAFRKRIRHDSVSEELDYIWKWFSNGMYSKVNKASQALIQTVTNWPETNINSIKFKFLSDLYYVRGLTLMHLKKYKSAFKCFRKDGEIGVHSNIKVSIDRTKDNIGRIHAIRGNFRLAIKLWSERLLEVTNTKEKAWLYYGIAQCYALEENYDKAIEMCTKCISNADNAKSYCWELNGNLLLANCAAMLGTMREANVRTNTLISLKAINRAYQCAVFLANVSVIRKIVEIVVHIYNSFKDIDLTMLEDVWSISLLEYARKTSIAQNESMTDIKGKNINNAVIQSNEHNFVEKNNNKIALNNFSKNNGNKSKIIFEEKNSIINQRYTNIENTIVNVCVDDNEFNDICLPKEPNKTQMSLSFCTSPITAVEVISSNENKIESLEDDWITESEYEEV